MLIEMSFAPKLELNATIDTPTVSTSIWRCEQGGAMERFLDMHMYITSALQKTDMKAVGLQLALDLLHEKVIVNFTALSFQNLLLSQKNDEDSR